MDTMLHELVHNVYGEHDEDFYGLLKEVTAEWELLTSKGYQGEGFFSKGRKLGEGHTFYKPSTSISEAERRRIREVVEGRGGRTIGPGHRLKGPEPGSLNGFDDTYGGRRLGLPDETLQDLSPRQLAAIAAEQRALDQRRCGAKLFGGDMTRERERAERDGRRTRAVDLPVLNDLQNYDLGDGDGDRWSCSRCTMKNPPLYLSCQVCQMERTLGPGTGSAVVDLTVEDKLYWDCRACTFRNENIMEGKCVICGTVM
jgi:DNA-dependent metalloprotease WSS1